MQNNKRKMDIEIQLQISSWHGNIHEANDNELSDSLGVIFVLSLESEYDEVEIQLVDYLHWAPGLLELIVCCPK